MNGWASLGKSTHWSKMAKKGRPKNVEFWLQKVGFLLVGINPSCLCFAGSERGIDSTHEGRHQAQSHADIRGEQSDSCLPGLVVKQIVPGESETFSPWSSLSSHPFS